MSTEHIRASADEDDVARIREALSAITRRPRVASAACPESVIGVQTRKRRAAQGDSLAMATEKGDKAPEAKKKKQRRVQTPVIPGMSGYAKYP